MFLDGLDELDQKIIHLLIKNARMPTLISDSRSASPA